MLTFAVAVLLQGSATVPIVGKPPAAEIPSATQPLRRGGDPNEVLCKRDIPTGHRIGSSDCRTRAQWEQLARAINNRNDTSRPTACFSGVGMSSPSC